MVQSLKVGGEPWTIFSLKKLSDAGLLTSLATTSLCRWNDSLLDHSSHRAVLRAFVVEAR